MMEGLPLQKHMGQATGLPYINDVGLCLPPDMAEHRTLEVQIQRMV